MRIIALDDTSMKDILTDLLKRDPNNYGEYENTVREIVERIRKEGDTALFEYTRRFDGAAMNPASIRVTEKEIREAMKEVDPALLAVMKKSMENIRRYHEKQLKNSWFDTQPDGTILGQKVTALESVGIYSGKGGGCRADRYGDASGKGWEGEFCNPDSGSSGRSQRGL